MKVETASEEGEIVTDEVGELVCTAPFPSRPVRFWNDPDDEKYHAAYFDFIPNVWRHGDYIEITERQSAIVYGRSDATLNPGGVRIGTAEIYGPVEELAGIEECIAIGQRHEGDTRIILFVVTTDGVTLSGDLEDKIRQQLRRMATPRHLPAKIIQVSEIPRTLNGKKVELAVTRVVHGQNVPNTASLANPGCLDQYRDRPELK
jgi:acetoacetyl-CoA synthetase